jgi:O-antigen ligase
LKQRVPSLVVAGFILLCMVLGGSGQGIWRNLALQLIGIALIVWATLVAKPADRASGAVAPYTLLFTGLLIVLIQLVPLPPDVWVSLPGREQLAEGLSLIVSRLPAMPISETPDASVMALFAAIPSIAAFIAVQKLIPSPRWIAAAIVGGMAMSILIGALQVAGGPSSPFYLYRIHNPGAVGFFANHNHMGTLLLVGIPMASTLIVSTRSAGQSSNMGRYGVGTALLILVIVGIVLNGSRAALGLAIPTILASLSLFLASPRWRRVALSASAITLVGAIAFLVNNPVGSTAFETKSSPPVESRLEIWTTTASAIRESFPVGTGLGSFERVYHGLEQPHRVTLQYINHAHNDYLELVLELGAAGLILIVSFLAWWAFTAIQIWRSPLSTTFARAATIATAVILAHSLVDYPLRTAAISAIFAACLALMVQQVRSHATAKPGDLRPTRHVALG